MAAPEGLEPPPETNVEDPGAHQLSEAETSDSDDQFTDAQSAPNTPHLSSPVPKTRVEKVDDSPSHGEVPGTDAYTKRQADAEPDEIAVDQDLDGKTPTETPIHEAPTTVLDASATLEDPEPAEKLSEADATPDVVLTSVEDPADDNDDEQLTEATGDPEVDDDFGDDFDDFEEGGQDDDFDDFEDGFQQPPTPSAPLVSSTPPPVQPLELPFPIPDFDGLGSDDVIAATEPCLDILFPPEELDLPPLQTLPKESSKFLTQRSASLWSQLVAPPPLAPPDWIRSRTRRLFLVSLGVPVDLDEILPASKQKKLVLPSLNIRATSPRTSSDSRSVSRLRQGEGNTSSTSVDTQGRPTPSRKRKGPPPEPELDLVAARYLCTTTDEALDGMTNEELKEHVSKLEAMQGTANEVLEYWKKRTDEKIGDREAFEGVIENLVKHARKVRK